MTPRAVGAAGIRRVFGASRAFPPRVLLLGVALVLGTVACDALPANVKDQGRARRLAAIGIERFDSTGSHRLAGVSATRTIAVLPLKTAELAGDTLSADYHTFRMRCGACHALPSPSTHPGYMWEGIVERMRKNAVDAGLMPMGTDDQAAVVRFLEKHGGKGS